MDRGRQFAILLLMSVTYCVNCEKVRWCVISDEESQKCWDMANALKNAGVTPEMECVRGANAADCMEQIADGDAHLITLDGGDIYHAGSVFGMKPVMGEEYDYGRYYYAVAVVKRENADWSFADLEGKKSCHTGVRKTSGWNVPIGFMINQGIMTVEDCQGDIKAAGSFFSQSCAPGALTRDYDPFHDNPDNLCELCIGELSNKCARNSHEPYYNYDGAFRCLVEDAGDVAFVKHTTVNDVIDEESDWASGVAKSDYRLLCKGGNSATIDSFVSCNLAKVVGHGVMTSGSASASDIAMYQQLLNDTQDLFKANDGTVFKMFDSSEYGKKDLMFKDATKNLYNVDSGSYQDYLGQDYVNTVQGLSQCLENSIRWCTVGDPETEKCRDMKEAFAGASLSKTISCYQANDHIECMQLIKDGLADVVTLDGGDAYKAGKDYGLVPVAGEIYSDDLEGTSYYAVAVAKKSSDFSINDLKGKKSCHTGIKKTSGWNVPIGYLVEKGQITPNKQCDIAKQVGNFFSQSCVPGAKSPKYDPKHENPDSLCALCKGSGSDKCARSDKEPYYNYAGAFKCLEEGAGEVAFVKHTTVPDNTGNPSDYELLCRDGTRKDVTEWESCNLARVPSHVVMTNTNNIGRADLWSFLNEAQQQFGMSSTGFKMFDSSNYGDAKDLLFKDSTKQLVSAGNKDIYQKWLGDEYLEAIEALNCKGIENGNKSETGNKRRADPPVNASGRVVLSPILIAFTLLVVFKSSLL